MYLLCLLKHICMSIDDFSINEIAQSPSKAQPLNTTKSTILTPGVSLLFLSWEFHLSFTLGAVWTHCE